MCVRDRFCQYWAYFKNKFLLEVDLLCNVLNVFSSSEVEEVEDGVSALVNITEKALRVRDKDSQTLVPGTAKSGAEYFATRSYHGLDIHPENNFPEPFLIGKSGRASGYKNETTQRSL